MAKAESSLERYRLEIDQLDETLLHCLAARFDAALHIAAVKREMNAEVFQAARFERVMGHYVEAGTRLGLGEDFLQRLCELVHAESCRLQQERVKDGRV